MKTVELFNRNNEYYWNVYKFVTEQGFKNPCEYCAEVLSQLGTEQWCIETATADMYEQSNMDLGYLYEDTLQYLDKNYNIVCIPTQGLWNGTYKGGLQDIKTLDICIHDDVQKITIDNKSMIIDVSHHDGNNKYILYFVDTTNPTVEEYYNELENNDYYDYVQGATLENQKDIQEYINKYAIELYDLWYNGTII